MYYGFCYFKERVMFGANVSLNRSTRLNQYAVLVVSGKYEQPKFD